MFRTIKSKLMAVVFFVIFGSFLVSSATGYYFISTDFGNHIREDNEVFAKSLADNISQVINNAYNITEGLALNSDVTSFSPERQKKLLVDNAARFNFFELLYIQKIDGNQTARSSGPLGYRGDRWWFQQMMTNPKPFVSKSYYSLTGDTTVTSIYFGIYNNNKLVGIMGSDLKLDALQKMIDDFSSKQEYYAYVLDGEGAVIAHPDKSQVTELNNYKTYKKTVLVKDAQGNALKDQNGHPKTEQKDIKVPDGLKAITEKVMKGESGSAEYQDLDGNTIVSAYSSIPLPGTSDSWSVITCQKKENAMAMVSSASWKNALITFCIAVISLVFMYFFANRITAPIIRMVEATKELASGNLAIDELQVTSRDEVGQLGEALNNMTVNLRKLVTQISYAGETVAAASEELTSNCQETNQTVDHVAKAVYNVAEKNSNHVEKIKNTSAAVEDMSASIFNIADSAQKISNVTIETTNVAIEGKKTVDKAIQQMSYIDKSTEQIITTVSKLSDSSIHINEIVNVIAGIAGQTNLLALNAAIEAARAGEQGRGFAVVAEEVRKLAEQSQEAAKQISELISENHSNINLTVDAMNAGTNEVKVGIQSVNEAGQTFDTISTQINQLSTQVVNISKVIQQMADNSQQIVLDMQNVGTVFKDTSDQMNNVSSATEEQSAAMAEVSSTSRNLAEMAQVLSETVSKFRV